MTFRMRAHNGLGRRVRRQSRRTSCKFKICPIDASITCLCHPGRRPAASRSAGSGLAAKYPAVTGGSCSLSKCPIKAPKHGEGCAFSSFQKSCLRSQSRRRTHNVSEKGRRSTSCVAFSALFEATMRPCSRRRARRPKNLQSSETLTSVRGATSRPKVRAPTTVAWKTTRRKW